MPWMRLCEGSAAVVFVWDKRAASASGLFWIAVPNSKAVAERISIGAWGIAEG